MWWSVLVDVEDVLIYLESSEYGYAIRVMGVEKLGSGVAEQKKFKEDKSWGTICISVSRTPNNGR